MAHHGNRFLDCATQIFCLRYLIWNEKKEQCILYMNKFRFPPFSYSSLRIASWFIFFSSLHFHVLFSSVIFVSMLCLALVSFRLLVLLFFPSFFYLASIFLQFQFLRFFYQQFFSSRFVLLFILVRMRWSLSERHAELT